VFAGGITLDAPKLAQRTEKTRRLGQHDTEHSAMKLMRMFQELPEHGTSCFPRVHFKQHIKLNKPCGTGSEFP
jgi:hypothetical protein